MIVVRSEDPPPTARRQPSDSRSAFWRAVAEQLREVPGKWALVCDESEWGYAGGIAGQIINGRLAAFRPAGTFAATTRTVDGKYRVYARFIGDPL